MKTRHLTHISLLAAFASGVILAEEVNGQQQDAIVTNNSFHIAQQANTETPSDNDSTLSKEGSEDC